MLIGMSTGTSALTKYGIENSSELASQPAKSGYNEKRNWLSRIHHRCSFPSAPIAT